MGYHLSARGGRFIMRIIGAATAPQPLPSQLQESEAEADWMGWRAPHPASHNNTCVAELWWW